MALLCATDNFVLRTLKSVPGLWGKLRYIARLRDQEGRYRHWGLARVYGDSVAETAIEDTHRLVFQQVLRKPIRKLLADADESAASAGEGAVQLLHELQQQRDELIPPGMGSGSALHFSSVLQTLAYLASSSKASSHRGA